MKNKDDSYPLAIPFQFANTLVTVISKSVDEVYIHFGFLNNENITGFSIKFKKDEIPLLIKQLEEFQEKDVSKK